MCLSVSVLNISTLYVTLALLLSVQHLSKEHPSIDSTLTGLAGRLGKSFIRTVGERDEGEQVRRRNAIKGDIGGKICYPIPSQVEGIIARLLPVFYFQQVGF